MNNKVISLAKVFLKDTSMRFKIFKNNSMKMDTKSIFFWMTLIIIIAITFFSYKVIDLLISAGQPQIFLNIFLFIVTMILMFQIILIATNVFFFSKELEYVLPMPISSMELLVAKFVVFLVITYITELIIAFIPLIIYGLMTHISLMYFTLMPILLILYPIVLISIIGLITVVLMKFAKIIKNKDVYQTIITTILLIIAICFESTAIDKINLQDMKGKDYEQQTQQAVETYTNIGDGFLIINPAVQILSKPNEIMSILKNFGLLILYDLIGISVFLLIGKKVYIKNILLGNLSEVRDRKKVVKINNKKKMNSVAKAYIIKEIKQLYRNPTFFMQLVFPVILILISVLLIVSVFIPIIDSTIQSDDTIKLALEQLVFNSEMLCVILSILAFLFSISALSLTAVSRERESAVVTKYIPVDFFKQFVYKNILQLTLNLIISAIVLGIVYILVSAINILQILLIFIISIFISLIHSYLMLIVDLKRPVLNWDSEYMLVKKNDNKIFQYVTLICLILIFFYLGNILKDIDINIAILVNLIVFIIIFLIINFLVRKYNKKLFKNIV